MDWAAYGAQLGGLTLLALAGWSLSLRSNDVSIVDSLWSLKFLLLAVGYAWLSGASGARAALVLTLVAIWALRLSAHITLRHRGQPEDHRYQAIRQRHEPGFRFKSLYIVFGLQAGLAWLIGMPLAAAMDSAAPLGWLDAVGVALWVAGMVFEVFGDAQLARFRQSPESRDQVLDSGLWRYTRHPNYFGECLLWWGYYLLAVAGGGAWSIASPVLMTWLLLRVSGVALLEQDIGMRRPRYAEYIARTNAFIPGPRRRTNGGS